MKKEPIELNPSSPSFVWIKTPTPSDWQCYLFGNKPGGSGFVWVPDKGEVPNMFIRFFMKICLGCTWKKK